MTIRIQDYTHDDNYEVGFTCLVAYQVFMGYLVFVWSGFMAYQLL